MGNGRSARRGAASGKWAPYVLGSSWVRRTRGSQFCQRPPPMVETPSTSCRGVPTPGRGLEGARFRLRSCSVRGPKADRACGYQPGYQSERNRQELSAPKLSDHAGSSSLTTPSGRLITRRSQVRILPPLCRRRLSPGVFCVSRLKRRPDEPLSSRQRRLFGRS